MIINPFFNYRFFANTAGSNEKEHFFKKGFFSLDPHFNGWHFSNHAVYQSSYLI